MHTEQGADIYRHAAVEAPVFKSRHAKRSGEGGNDEHDKHRPTTALRNQRGFMLPTGRPRRKRKHRGLCAATPDRNATHLPLTQAGCHRHHKYKLDMIVLIGLLVGEGRSMQEGAGNTRLRLMCICHSPESYPIATTSCSIPQSPAPERYNSPADLLMRLCTLY